MNCVFLNNGCQRVRKTNVGSITQSSWHCFASFYLLYVIYFETCYKIQNGEKFDYFAKVSKLKPACNNKYCQRAPPLRVSRPSCFQ